MTDVNTEETSVNVTQRDAYNVVVANTTPHVGVAEENTTTLKQQNRALKRRIDELTNELEREQQRNKMAKIVLTTHRFVNSEPYCVEIYRDQKELLYSTIKTLMGKRRTPSPYLEEHQSVYEANQRLLKNAMPQVACKFLLDNWPGRGARRRVYLLLFNCATALHRLRQLQCEDMLHAALRRINDSNLLPRDLPFIRLLCTPGLRDDGTAYTSLERQLAQGRIIPPSVQFLRVDMNKRIYWYALDILRFYNWNVPDTFFQQ